MQMFNLFCLMFAMFNSFSAPARAQTSDIGRAELRELRKQPCHGFLKIVYTNKAKPALFGYIINRNAVPTHLCYVDPNAVDPDEQFKPYTISHLGSYNTLKGKMGYVAAEIRYSGSTLTIHYGFDAMEKDPDQTQSFRIDYDSKSRSYSATNTVTGNRVSQITIQPHMARVFGKDREVGVEKLTVQ